VPLASYLERYRGRQIDEPLMGDWANAADVPYTVRMARLLRDRLTAEQIADVRRAFYAQCTHIDHQIRLLIGTLNDEEILDNTIILFCADHGDMLGDHGLFAKRLMYEGSAHIPLILLDTEQGKRVAVGHVDMRLAGLQDVMPTLLELCGIPVPATCEGLSLVGNKARSTLYAEWGVGSTSTRMIHNGRYKMIWYPAGNRFQLFDLEADPHELSDISGQEAHVKLLGRLRSVLARNFYGTDTKHFRDNKIYGLADPKRKFRASRDLSRQRGLAFPARSGGGEDEE